jgi:hypothetical protein
MKYFYRNAILPPGKGLLLEINNAAAKLREKLENLDLNTLTISHYNKRYLGDYIKSGSLRAHLQRFTYILAWSVTDAPIPLDKFVFIDYGGGCGLLSLLAKELDIGTVIYNDIYDVSCKDAKVIGETINSTADYYIQGDIDDLLAFVNGKSMPSIAISSHDVIEHIYDVEYFFARLSEVKSDSLRIVMSSGANEANPRLRRALMRAQIKAENQDREKDLGHKERDSLKAFVSIRRDIIAQHAPHLSEKELTRLARATRGLVRQDILKLVDTYLEKGKEIPVPDHPTNTCDPLTGNWAERLMDTRYLEKNLCDKGFNVDIFSGYYGSSSNVIKRLAGLALNIIISNLKEKGLILAPFYTIYACKET